MNKENVAKILENLTENEQKQIKELQQRVKNYEESIIKNVLEEFKDKISQQQINK